MAHRSENKEFVEALSRGLEIIRAFHQHKPLRTVSDLAAELNLARPTVHRILQTLEQLGYVVQTDGGYYLSAKVVDLGVSYIAARGFYGAARPHLEQLANDVDHAISLAELVDSDIFVIGRAEVPMVVAYTAAIGQRMPAHATALGRVLLAGLSDDELTERLETPSLATLQPLARIAIDDARAAVLAVREQGWAMVDQTMSIGFRAIAAPITDRNGNTVAAIGLIAHIQNVSMDRLMDDFCPRLVKTASRVSAEYAHVATLPISRPSTSEPRFGAFDTQSTPA